MINNNTNIIKFAAAGDLLLTSQSGNTPGRGTEALSEDIINLFRSCDVVFANLECTLAGENTIPTEPRVVSTEYQVESLKEAGIKIVSLGNNHTFDCFDEGFLKLGTLLSNLEITWCGAGMNLDEALQAAVIETMGLKLAVISIVDKSSGPYRFAGKNTSGVAPLNIDIICSKIRELKKDVDHVIVSPHWGMERFRIPSLIQIEQARDFVDAGASMIIGHHPHVLQGMEFYQKAPIAYSLGNFIANNVYWTNGDYLTWSKFERTGCILVAELDSNSVINVKQIPVVDDGRQVTIDKTNWGANCINRVNRMLEKGVTPQIYSREAFIVSTIKPILSHLKWTELKQIRPKHFIKLYKHLCRAVLS